MRKTRDWIAIYLSDWLENGIARTLTPAQQGVFLRLQCLAARSKEPGTIHIKPGAPYPAETLARILRIKTRLLTSTLTALATIDKLKQDADGIHITNFITDQPAWQAPLPGIGDHAMVFNKRGKRSSAQDGKHQYQTVDPDKFKRGSKGAMVCQTAEDIRRVKEERAARKKQSSTSD